MRIEGLYLRDVGPFDELRLDFVAGTDPSRADAYILAGENGTGKTTVLMALAEALGQGHDPLGDTGVGARLRSPRSRIEVATSTGGVIVHAWEERVVSSVLRPESAVSDNGARRGRRYALLDGMGSAGSTWALPSAMPRSATDFAAFSYSGMRRLSNKAVGGILPIVDAPLLNALSHDHDPTTDLFAQWVANTRAEAAFAAEESDLARSAHLKADIEAVSHYLSEVTGQHVVLGGRGRNGDFSPWVELDGLRLSFDLLPEGLKSLLAWLGDLTMRLSRTAWKDDLPLRERTFLLLMDEIDVHLHPRWQRRVLPVLQRLFPRAQIVLSTHSPFVVGSATDARVYPLTLDGPRARLMDAHELSVVDHEPARGLAAQTGVSYSVIVDRVFGIQSEFDQETEDLLAQFRALRATALAGRANADDRADLARLMQAIAARSPELQDIMAAELRQLRRALGEPGVASHATPDAST